MSYAQRQLALSEFPELLKETPDGPTTLYIRGTMPPKDAVYLCVVGSRASTPYGRRMCQKLIAGLASYPIVIVSGMAIGMDSEAHRAALDIGLPTVAVLPSSLDAKNMYPSQNKVLAERILKNGGALMSEYKEEHKAALYDFPKRNRIAAGMSKAALILEAGERSGTLITARLAMDYNREVLCVPHELDKESGKGVNRLIREGATLVRNSADILEALGFKVDTDPLQLALPTDLSAPEAKILQALTEAQVKDELIETTDLSAQDLNIALSSLQLRGLIVERLGKIERV